jgi:Immunoglobulin I-set domain
MIKYPYDSTYWTFKRTERGNTEMPLNTEYVEADNTLVINFATKDHTGTYTCVAKADWTEVKASVDIVVEYRTEIIDSNEESKMNLQVNK